MSLVKHLSTVKDNFGVWEDKGSIKFQKYLLKGLNRYRIFYALLFNDRLQEKIIKVPNLAFKDNFYIWFGIWKEKGSIKFLKCLLKVFNLFIKPELLFLDEGLSVLGPLDEGLAAAVAAVEAAELGLCRTSKLL